MDLANCFETHYYLTNSDHQIDALVRNKCEAELLEIFLATAEKLNLDISLLKEIPRDGGYREWWTVEATKDAKVLIIISVCTLLLQIPNCVDSTISLVERNENNRLLDEKIKNFELSNEEIKLDIEIKKRALEGIKRNSTLNDKITYQLNSDPKITKHKSNFYSHLENSEDINEVGFSILNKEFKPISSEIVVCRQDFHKYIITLEKLISETDENAIVEITAPNLSGKPLKWRGIYNGIQINFDMKDRHYLTEVNSQKISFSKGSKIRCELEIEREKDEANLVKIINYSVITVLEKIDNEKSYETLQGKNYRIDKRKKTPNIQSSLFD